MPPRSNKGRWSKLKSFRAMMRGLTARKSGSSTNRGSSEIRMKSDEKNISGRSSKIVPCDSSPDWRNVSESSLVVPTTTTSYGKSARRLFFDEMERNIHKNMKEGLLIADVPSNSNLDVLPDARRDSMDLTNTRARFTLDDIFVDEVVKKKSGCVDASSLGAIMSARSSNEMNKRKVVPAPGDGLNFDTPQQSLTCIQKSGSLQDKAPADFETSKAPSEIRKHASNTSGLVHSNSTGRLHIDSTLNDPDVTATIECVSRSILALINRPKKLPCNPDPPSSTMSPQNIFDDDDPTYIDRIPSVQELITFVKTVYSRGEMHVECLVTAFIFIEKLLSSYKGTLQLTASNWRPIIFSTMILASKICDDESPVNADWCYVCPSFTVKRINTLELALLTAFKFKPTVAASHYAKYYFHFRSMAARIGLIGGDTIQPLDVKVARRIAETSANRTLPPHKPYQKCDSGSQGGSGRDSPSINSQRSKSFAGPSGKEITRDNGRVSAVLEQLVDMDPTVK